MGMSGAKEAALAGLRLEKHRGIERVLRGAKDAALYGKKVRIFSGVDKQVK